MVMNWRVRHGTAGFQPSVFVNVASRVASVFKAHRYPNDLSVVYDELHAGFEIVSLRISIGHVGIQWLDICS